MPYFCDSQCAQSVLPFCATIRWSPVALYLLSFHLCYLPFLVFCPVILFLFVPITFVLYISVVPRMKFTRNSEVMTVLCWQSFPRCLNRKLVLHTWKALDSFRNEELLNKQHYFEKRPSEMGGKYFQDWQAIFPPEDPSYFLIVNK